MKKLITYLRVAFCKHDFVYAEEMCKKSKEKVNDWGDRQVLTQTDVMVNRTCPKCGDVKKYWKLL